MEQSEFVLRDDMQIHLIGIGGTGMSAIARVLLGRGLRVSGSDLQASQVTQQLAAEGATIYVGHAAAHITGAAAVVMTSAASLENPEVQAAIAGAVPLFKRSDFLGYLMAGKIGIAVAGTHGKTTTTGMIAQILLEADTDPTIISGGNVPSLGSNGRYGEGDYFVIEADEYDHMFLGLQPEVIVLTSIEHDHPDIFPTAKSYREAFLDFIELIPAGGRLIACWDDPGVVRALREARQPDLEVTSYGIGKDDDIGLDYQAVDIRPNSVGGLDFLVETDAQMIGLARLRIPGDHNVRNALAAIIVALDVGVDFNIIRNALAAFSGVNRRFQIVGEVADVTIVDDYAHHPTEIIVTLRAAQQRFPGRRIWAIWQPHTFSRTRQLLDRFATCFDAADRVVALDIFQSRETDDLGLDTSIVVETMDHPQVDYIPGKRAAADFVLERVRPGDVIITLGAGDGNLVGKWILEGLSEKLVQA